MMLMWRYFMVGATGRATGGKTVRRIFIAGVFAATATGEKPLKTPEDLAKHTLLHVRHAVTGRHIPDNWG